MRKKRLNGQIGFCNNTDLGIAKPGGHYVYIREVIGKRCNVNVVTSLEDTHHKFEYSKICNLKKGYNYAIPKNDAGFPRWSAVTNNPIQGINVSKISDIGKIRMKKRHRFYIDKYLK